MTKKSLVFVLVLFLLLNTNTRVRSFADPIRIFPGTHTLKVNASDKDPSSIYQIWALEGNPLEFVFNHFPPTMKVQLLEGEIEHIARSETQLIISIHVSYDQNVQFWIYDSHSSNCTLYWKYESPHHAFVAFSKIYAEYSYPWQRRFYLGFHLSPISGNERKYEEHLYFESYPVTLGAPYSWGGKQSIESIHRKLNNAPDVTHWMEYYYQKDTLHPVNLDAYESCFDHIPGPENPQYWAGVDCSGLLEVCSQMAGLIYSWRTADIISYGDYRSCSNFGDIRPGDIFILKRNGIVVHFGIVSRKGATISSTWIIHSAWFTSYRYNTNALLRVAQTSMGEFCSFYTWEIRRYHAQQS